ncbi:unnamed protein product [Menidia menidia]|uniref:(Atlantic silverside) hypothetical protein n=1 Tax=Menidia menidia TaxID=238744 RepID=A0A8S4BI22_9TELE|nr:unnamed protein product [Menidia menidia]
MGWTFGGSRSKGRLSSVPWGRTPQAPASSRFLRDAGRHGNGQSTERPGLCRSEQTGPGSAPSGVLQTAFCPRGVRKRLEGFDPHIGVLEPPPLPPPPHWSPLVLNKNKFWSPIGQLKLCKVRSGRSLTQISLKQRTNGWRGKSAEGGRGCEELRVPVENKDKKSRLQLHNEWMAFMQMLLLRPLQIKPQTACLQPAGGQRGPSPLPQLKLEASPPPPPPTHPPTQPPTRGT